VSVFRDQLLKYSHTLATQSSERSGPTRRTFESRNSYRAKSQSEIPDVRSKDQYKYGILPTRGPQICDLAAPGKEKSQVGLHISFSAGGEIVNVGRNTATLKDVTDHVSPSDLSDLPPSPAIMEPIPDMDFFNFPQFDGLEDENFFSFFDELSSDGK
jgi:hypothetical protein